MPIYNPTTIKFEATFSNTGNNKTAPFLIDPATIECTVTAVIGGVAQAPTVYTYPSTGNWTKVSTGYYILEVEPTGAGIYQGVMYAVDVSGNDVTQEQSLTVTAVPAP